MKELKGGKLRNRSGAPSFEDQLPKDQQQKLLCMIPVMRIVLVTLAVYIALKSAIQNSYAHTRYMIGISTEISCRLFPPILRASQIGSSSFAPFGMSRSSSRVDWAGFFWQDEPVTNNGAIFGMFAFRRHGKRSLVAKMSSTLR